MSEKSLEALAWESGHLTGIANACADIQTLSRALSRQTEFGAVIFISDLENAMVNIINKYAEGENNG